MLIAAAALALLILPEMPPLQIDTRLPHLRDIKTLHDRCGLPVEACTKFLDPTLNVACEHRDGEWQMRPVARTLALIYLYDRSFLDHEWKHVFDIQAGLRLYFGELKRSRFRSEDACRAAATLETDAFEDRFRQLVVKSNAFRH